MADLIDRQAAIEALARIAREKFNLSDEFNYYLAGLMDGEVAIKQLPSAQPEPKTGRWILVKGSNGKDYHKCSCCLHTQEITGVKNYCSVCGADMMEVEHETQNN